MATADASNVHDMNNNTSHSSNSKDINPSASWTHHWCTIESTPEVFNSLMWRNGIKGAYIQELYSLDQPTFRQLSHQSVYGFIFLIRPQGSRLSKVQSLIQQPDYSNVYFAKQVIPDACGTQAILSVALNTRESDDGLDIGPLLRNFKEFTTGFSPLNKGLAMTNCDQLRENHNSSAGQYEQRLPSLPLSFSLPLSYSNTSPIAPALYATVQSSILPTSIYTKQSTNASGKKSESANIKRIRQVKKPSKRKRGNGQSGSELKEESSQTISNTYGGSFTSNSAVCGQGMIDVSKSSDKRRKKNAGADAVSEYHYVAYVHVDGFIWELDGLQPEPICLTACTKDTWVDKARLEFMARVLSFSEDERSFVLMAMIKDPLSTLSQRIHYLRHSTSTSSLSASNLSRLQQRQAEDELKLLEETLAREERDRKEEKDTIRDMEADFRPAIEFFMKALAAVDQ
ncbi:Ubiquitin carboxyl-terminal hydrolase bap1 [Linnemannia zychae]|nr:Ubiquitin carboxyl-terminal hydrolase bap1 [Linnemannia zychae]